MTNTFDPCLTNTLNRCWTLFGALTSTHPPLAGRPGPARQVLAELQVRIEARKAQVLGRRLTRYSTRYLTGSGIAIVTAHRWRLESGQKLVKKLRAGPLNWL